MADRPRRSASNQTAKVPMNCSSNRRGDIFHPRRRPQVEFRQQHASHDAAAAREQEQRRDLPTGNRPGHGRRNGQAIDEQRAGVVEQTFALQYDDEPMRRTHPAQHGRRGRRVGGRYDRPERDGRGPTHPRHVMSRYERDRDYGHAHRQDGQAAHRHKIAFQVAWARRRRPHPAAPEKRTAPGPGAGRAPPAAVPGMKVSATPASASIAG